MHSKMLSVIQIHGKICLLRRLRESCKSTHAELLIRTFTEDAPYCFDNNNSLPGKSLYVMSLEPKNLCRKCLILARDQSSSSTSQRKIVFQTSCHTRWGYRDRTWFFLIFMVNSCLCTQLHGWPHLLYRYFEISSSPRELSLSLWICFC